MRKGRFVSMVLAMGITANLFANGTVLASDTSSINKWDSKYVLETNLVSLSDSGTQVASPVNSTQMGVSADGRYVVFDSSNAYVTDDTNKKADVFVRDTKLGTITRVSQASDGTQSNGGSTCPVISQDGRYVAFQSDATNLVTGDTNGKTDIFVRDTKLGTTKMISVTSNGMPGDNISICASISADGRYISFVSYADDLVTGDTNCKLDAFVYDMQTASIKRVSVGYDGSQSTAVCYRAIMSPDGQSVAIFAIGGNLASGTLQYTYHLFVHNMQTNTDTLVSVDSNGNEGNGSITDFRYCSFSEDGRYITFQSSAANLVSDDTNGVDDVFVHDIQTGETKRVSVASDGTQGNKESCTPSISGDGRYVVFDSIATNFVASDYNTHDVFVHDMQTGMTRRISVYSGVNEKEVSDGSSEIPVISSDGKCVVYLSDAGSLVNNDTNSWMTDIFETNTIDPATHAKLSDIFLSEGSLPFLPDTTTYSVNVDSIVDSITVKPYIQYNLGTVTVNGIAAVSGSASQSISLAYGTNTISVAVTAEDGITTNTYTITVNRATASNVNLKVLGVSAGSLSPKFASATTEYTVNLDAGITNMTVTPVVQDNTSTIKVNGSAVSSGSASQIINLAAGSNTIEIVVTATDSTTKTYTVTVHVSSNFWDNKYLMSSKIVSVSSDGTLGNALSSHSSISADGRYIAFNSAASNLVSNDTNGDADTFVRDTQTDKTTMVDVASDGTVSAGIDQGVYMPPAISADGRYVVFLSSANNLVSGDTDTYSDLFLRDMQAGTTTRVNVSSVGTVVPTDGFINYAISGDGRYVAFSSLTNLDNGDFSVVQNLYIHDMQTGKTQSVAVSSSGIRGNKEVRLPSLSYDGRYIAFESDSTNLVPDDTNGANDIFVHDMQTGTTKIVSTDSNGAIGDKDSYSTMINNDGRYVTFVSDSTNLVTGDTNGKSDIFVHDMQTGETKRVSVASDGTQGDDKSGRSYYRTYISGNGRYVTFESDATNLVPDDTNAKTDIFVRDTWMDKSRRVSVSVDGTQGNDESACPTMSSDGKYITYYSHATNLTTGDTNNTDDVFLTTAVDPTSNANLSNLTISSGTLSPTFATDMTDYTTSVDSGVGSITVTPTLEYSGATVKVNGTAVTSGSASQAISLSSGTNTIPVVVTAADGTTVKTYTITVTKEVSASYAITMKVTSVAAYNEAVVTIKNSAGSVLYTLNPGTDGMLTTPLLPAGSYTVECSKEAFLKTTIRNIPIADKAVTLSDVVLIPGDLDGDGKINTTDTTIINSCYNVTSSSGKYKLVYDFNRDGKINTSERSAVFLNYNKSNKVIDYVG